MLNKKPTLICIIGRSGSGKDTIAYIMDIYKSVEQLVSYTTRPMRDSEENGEDHYFITEDDYQREYKELDKLAYTEINGYRYFTLYDQLTADDHSHHSYVIDPKGLYWLQEHFGDKIRIITVYVKCDVEERKWRYEHREEDITIPFEERNKAEDEQFIEFEQKIKDGTVNCDLIIDNTNLKLLDFFIYD